MQLAQRKEKILTAVVENYIATSEPVGSRALQNNTDLNVSSATIRNELADLTAMGFLIQPHTSAGRIPSEIGYRYYIDNMMTKKELSAQAKEKINFEISQKADAPEHILETAAQLLSNITGLVAIASTPDGKNSRVHKLRFVPIGRHTAMVVFITSTGMVKTRLFRCEFVITPEIIAVFEQALNKVFVGIPLPEITKPFIQTIAASLGSLSLFLPNVLEAISELANVACSTSVSVVGKVNLLYIPEFDLKSGRDILRYLSDSRAVSDTLTENCIESCVLVGSESGREELKDASLLISRYEISGKKAGAIALLGPTRMDYSSKIAILDYTTALSSKLISELVSEE